MKNIEIGQIIELNNKQSYIVLSTAIYDGDKFLYLSNTNNPQEQELGIVIIEDGKLRVEFIDTKDENNKEIIKKLMNIFKNEMANYISKMN